MRDVHFDVVALQTTAPGHRRTISTVSEAADELLNHWPLTEGERLSAAKKSCTLAFLGDLSGTCVRLAFIEACKEAGISIVVTEGEGPSQHEIRRKSAVQR